MNRQYSEASAEVLDILRHTAKEKVDLIPVKFINYLKESAARDYVVNLDYSLPINEMNIKIETKGILGTICRNWWWNTEQKQEYKRIVREREMKRQEELREKYDIDREFERRKRKTEETFRRFKELEIAKSLANKKKLY